MAAASTATLSTFLSIDEYLNTTYRPDVDFVDGRIEERNVGEFDHGDMQLEIGSFLRVRQKEWSIRVVTETRVRISATRVRIPDVCVLPAGLPRERVITHPPLLCIEVPSPRDRLSATRKRAQDYFDMGVQTVWIIDPMGRKVYDCSASTMTERTDGRLVLAGTPVEVSILQMFSTLDL